MTAAALLFDPAASPAPTSSPALPRPEAPVGDFANLMEGRLSPRFRQGQGTETSAESASTEDLGVDADLVLCHRPSVLPVAPETVLGPTEGVCEVEDGLASLTLPETQAETLPLPPEGVPVELIAGCWVWPVPVQPMPQTASASPATSSEGTTPDLWSNGAAAPMARPSAPAVIPPTSQTASTVEAQSTPTPPSPAAPVPPSPLANPATVVLDATQWQAVAETLPQSQGTE